MPKKPKSVRVKWPVGPHYVKWTGGKRAHAWANYKIKSADWFIETLRMTARNAGSFDRYAGIEMAVDGALSSLCAAVDAAGSELFVAYVRQAEISQTGLDSVAVENWESIFSVARAIGVALPSEKRLTKALLGSGSRAPEGWYAQLRQLHAQAVQHNVLVRRFSVTNKPGRFIEVPGRGPCRPDKYLRSVRKDVAKLVKALLADTDALPKLLPAKSRAQRHANGRSRPLPDLLVRAHVLDDPANSAD